MTKIIKKQLQEKINNLLEIYQGLKQLQRFKLNDLKENIENIWAVTFGLIAAIEATLDIAQYILAEKGVKSESYGQIPFKLFEEKIINQKFKEEMQKMIGFRNCAIHNYPSLEEEHLYEILQKDVEEFKKFLKIVVKLKV
ncbi:DUF86 domain-containing protein [Candidatus Kuenenbacteria bacterium]|nr:DUF86 domain-containing protein [Candidatus Kuenenbacteria bacterium]